MERNTRKNTAVRIVVISIGSVALLAAVVLVVVSLIFPYGVFGYGYVFFDSHSHSYRMNETFRYYKLDFKLSGVTQKALPVLEDCSKLLQGGIFNPNADKFFAGQSNPNYEPKEDCEARNSDATMAASKHKDLKISYNITNLSNDTVTVPSSWLTAYATTGDKIYQSTKGLTVGPRLTISNNATTPIGNDTSLSSMNVQIKGLAIQTVTAR